MPRYLPFATIVALLAGLAAAIPVRAETKNVGDILEGIITDQPRYPLGEPVIIGFALRNLGPKPITYTFPSSKLFDVWITRGGAEVYRYSKGRVYLQATQTLTLQPNEVRRFEVIWNQLDNSGKQVGPGSYTAYAQLTSSGKQLPPVKASIQVGTTAVAAVPVDNIRQAIQNASALSGKTVYLTATFRGTEPTSGDANTKAGPPVNKSDWIVCDSTGCMYVTGLTTLDATRDAGSRVKVTGKLRTATNGQVYMVLISVQKIG